MEQQIVTNGTPHSQTATISLPTEVISPSVGAEHLMLIVPSDEGERQASAMENFFQACASDEEFSLELVGTRREQGFVLRASSAEQLVLLSKQISAQYPQAELQRIAPTTDPLLLHDGEHAVVGEFALSHKPFLPLKTFSGKVLAEPGADPLAGILAAMEPLGSGQRCICQLALVRAPEEWISRYIRKSVEHPLQGERDATYEKRLPSDTAEGIKTVLLVGGVLSILLGYRWYLMHAWFLLTLLLIGLVGAGVGMLWWKAIHDRQDIYDMKLVSEKLARQAFYTRLRVIMIGQQSTSTEAQLLAHIKRLEVSYRQFTLASANSLVLKRTRTILSGQKQAAELPSAKLAFPYRHPILRILLHRGAPGPDIWNGLELSGAFHLPQAFTDLPLVRRLSVKHLLASPEIARQIEQAPAPLPPALIGYSRHRGYAVPVYLPYATLFSHILAVARSRYGKSTLLQLLIQAAMRPVRDGSLQPGIFVIDPHKDLIEDLLLLIPPDRVKDVLLLDLTDTEYPMALNPLDASMGFTRDQAVANLMSSFERVWSDFWGPRMAYFLKAICLLLYTLNERKVQKGQADKQYTLLDINRLLQYREYALKVLQELDMSETWHQELFAWWVNVYFALPPQSSFRNEIIMPIVSKLGLFQDNQLIRRIVGQPITKAPVHLAITEGKIVLCALSSRDMEDAAVNVLGSTLINLLHRSFNIQQAVPLEQRRRVLCAADEFHALAGGDWDRLLSEDAKNGCSLVLVAQNLKRLNKIRDGLLEMVFSNCDNIFAFNTSAADAKLLEEELRGVVEPKHIISQPRLHSYARLSIPNYPLQIVSVAITPPASWQRSSASLQQADAIRKANRQRNTHASDIDRHYAEHMAQFLDVDQYSQRMQLEGRGIRAAQDSKQKRAQANKLEEDMQHIQRQQKSQQQSPTAFDRESQSNQADEGTSTQDKGKVSTKEGSGAPASIGNSFQGGSTARAGASEGAAGSNEGTRNHPRSKRNQQKKEAVGVPPPRPTDPNDNQDEFHLRLPMKAPGSGSSWGYERERRE